MERRSTYKPVPLKPYTPVPLKPYTPVPKKPYVATPTKPYLPAAPKPYLPQPLKPFLPKPRKENIGEELYENEVQALGVIGEAGGAATIRRVAHLLVRPPTKTHNDCEVLAEADYIDLLESGLCRMKPRGWAELEKRGHHFPGSSFPYLDISYRELHILMAIAEVGGATTLLDLRRTLDVDKSELLSLCRGLGQDGYLDVFQSGQCIISRRGWQELNKGGYVQREDSPNVSEEEFQVLKVLGSVNGPSTLRSLAYTLGMERRDLVRLCHALGERDFVDFYQSGQCTIKKKGWEELEKRDIHRPEAGQVTISDEEWRTLEIIGQLQGDVMLRAVGEAMGVERRETLVLCESIAQREYIDFLRDGRCVMKPRGWQVLEQRGYQRPPVSKGRVSNEEMEILTAIWLAGGRITVNELMKILDWERRRVGNLCQTLAQRDYINLQRPRTVMLTTLGIREMGGAPPPKAQKETGEQPAVLADDERQGGRP